MTRPPDDQGSSQLREATTATIMLAVMPIESANERKMILAICHFDIARPTKCRNEGGLHARDDHHACGYQQGRR
jgi:hypothetical protein